VLFFNLICCIVKELVFLIYVLFFNLIVASVLFERLPVVSYAQNWPYFLCISRILTSLSFMHFFFLSAQTNKPCSVSQLVKSLFYVILIKSVSIKDDN
jgi:hypothetical protein